MSEVEQLFTQLQQKMGGNLRWEELNIQHQQAFIQSVNTLLSICSFTK
jgi:hypothetical protein